MTPLQQTAKSIERLTYAEMMILASVLGDALKKETTQVAEALLGIGEHLPQETSTEDDKVLREAFSRTRSITISKESKGWQVSCSTIPGATVHNSDLRAALHQLLDTIVVVHVLKK